MTSQDHAPSDDGGDQCAPSAPLADLISRVGAATGADRTIDAEIALAVDGYFLDGEDPWGRPKYCYNDGSGQVSPGQGHDMLVRRYTGSLDECVALANRAFGASGAFWKLRLDFPVSGNCDNAYVHVWAYPKWEAVSGEAPTPALALCIAILKARSQDGTSGRIVPAREESKSPLAQSETSS
jgi:hypothetical protein